MPKECDVCGKVMSQSEGCDAGSFKDSDGKTYPRIRAGDPGDIFAKNTDPTKRCPSCHALHGHYHHHGCECERCPVCGETFAFCSCEGSYD